MQLSGMLRFIPFLQVLGSILSLCIGTSLAKAWLFPIIGASGTTALRTGFSALILLVIWRPWRRRIGGRDLGFIALYGITLGMMNLCFYLALQYIPFGLAVAIEFIGPLSVTLLFSRQLIDFIWIALAIAGIGLVLPLGGNHSGLDMTGVMYALCAAFGWGMYIIFGKKVSHLPGGFTVSIGLIFASMVTFPVGIIDASAILAHPGLLVIGLGIALISSSVPMSLEMAALRRLPHKAFGIMVSMEPAVAALVALVMLAETLTPQQVFAICLSITAGMGSAITARSKPTVTAQ